MRDESRTSPRLDRQAGVALNAPHLFVVMYSERPMALPMRCSLWALRRVELGRMPRDYRRWKDLGAGALLEQDENDDTRVWIRCADRQMSKNHAAIVRGGDGWEIEDRESTNGTFVNGEVLDTGKPRLLIDRDLIEVGGTFIVFRESVPEAGTDLPTVIPLPGREKAPAFATFSASLASELSSLGDDVSTVLILGPTGTGKEVAARTIHALSGRTGPLIAINAAALPGELVEAELFGNVKNYPNVGMEERRGLIREAAGGTLFLDEIAEMRLDLQAKLLRVIRERTVRPLGGHRDEPVDVRWLAATNRDLAALVRQGRFREDLYSRLGTGSTIHLPPLAERKEDIGLLVGAILRALDAQQVSFDPIATRALLMHDWPMNVGELRNCLESASRKAKGGLIHVDHLPHAVRASLDQAPGARAPGADAVADAADLAVDRARAAELLALAEQHAGNVVHMSKATGTPRSTLQKQMKRLGIDPARFRKPST